MKQARQISYLILRYLILILSAFNGLWVFYYLFTPLTSYPVVWILRIFSQASLSSALYQEILVPEIIFKDASILLVSACIAGSAYYLLLILNLTTPMSFKTRLKSLAFSFLSLLVLNIIRISLFSLLLTASFSLFNWLHMLVWYGLSSLLVAAIWIATIKIFKIKNIPVYADLRFLFKQG